MNIEAKFQLSKFHDLFTLTISKEEALTFIEVDAIFKNVLQQLSGGTNEQSDLQHRSTNVYNGDQKVNEGIGTEDANTNTGDSDNAAGS